MLTVSRLFVASSHDDHEVSNYLFFAGGVIQFISRVFTAFSAIVERPGCSKPVHLEEPPTAAGILAAARLVLQTLGRLVLTSSEAE